MELTPDFSVIINGADNFPKDRMVAIRTNDEAGFVSDSCEIELSNHDDALDFFNTEARIEIALGYQETGLTKIGTYYVKEIAIDGARKIVRIKANTMRKSLISQKSQNNENSLKDFVQDLAEDYEGAIDSDLGDFDLSDYPQFAESNMNYLTRIAQKVGGIAKPVDNHIVIAQSGSGKSVSGKNLPETTIDASEVADYSCVFKETESGGGTGTVYANWYDKNTGEYHLVQAGSSTPETELNEIFASERAAMSAAQARFKRIAKSNVTLSLKLGGAPTIFAESPLALSGFSSKIPTNWIIKRVTHELSESGFMTSVECYQK